MFERSLDLCRKLERELAQTRTVDWEEMDRLDAFGVFGGRIIPYNGVWKIMLTATMCELWSLKTKEEAETKFADAVKKSGYTDADNPLLARPAESAPEGKAVKTTSDLVVTLNAEGYKHVLKMPDGSLCGILEQLYTTGLFCGLDAFGYQRRYCYEKRQDAVDALLSWDGRSDPPGPWIKEKSSDRLGPGAVE